MIQRLYIHNFRCLENFSLPLKLQTPLRLRHRRHCGNARLLRQHGITADIELIPIQKINEAYDRLLESDVKYRFVVGMASLKQ